MKVLVTGASGSLGSHLVETFAARGHLVTGLTRSAATRGHLHSASASFVTGDVTDQSSLAEGVFRQDCIVHTVAKVGGGNRWRDHLATDLAGTTNVLDAAVRAGCPRFIHVSSIAALDLPGDGGAVEDKTPPGSWSGQSSLYARSKLEVERLVGQYDRDGRIAVTVLRPSIFLGRYDRHVTPGILRFLRSPWAGIIGGGENLIPCVDLAELAEAVVTAAECDRAAGRTYNLSGRLSVPLADLLGMHAKEIGRPLQRRYSERGARAMATIFETGARLLQRKTKPLLDHFMIDVATMNCTVDCSGAAADLNWKGRSDLRDSIKQSISWQKELSG